MPDSSLAGLEVSAAKTTVLDAAGILLIAGGVAALLGLPAGAIVLGAFALAVSWRMTHDPASVPGWLARRRART